MAWNTGHTVPDLGSAARGASKGFESVSVPLLIVGVDGVLAPLRAMTHEDTWGDWRAAGGVGVRVPVSPLMGASLKNLPAKIVVCSDWGSRADILSEELGWDGVEALRRELPSRWWWKLDAVRAFLGARPRRPIAWVDDELRDHPEAAAWLMRAGVPALLLSTDPKVGITPSDVERLATFCTENSSSPAVELSSAARAEYEPFEQSVFAAEIAE